ncbi:hypothetical protein [Streptomyces himalayensis]|uniref:Bacterial Ig-like domain-containing protein n=1 Tax=Streptomyces himalayensis subsp. himalayensis TaxID=2756131 RepID=A0A7W0DM68_9ACTN|nr:hypothetical protein [Streptomyces himalayensis]MBA2947666.1 hypothetical protein [Streptomyces himalayensis subsp. himalayensis]
MSKAAAKGRHVVQGIDASGGYPVEYRFAHSRSGNRHLTVVFANIYAPDDYGWATGILDSLRSNVLWIRDRFEGGNTYYLCKGMDFAVERSVIGLISKVMKALGLTPGDVTLWGSSKGGSAALYFGLRYGFRNIVASVPQLRIGTFVRDVYPDTGRHMLGEAMSDDNVRVLDAILPDLLMSGANPDAHIYVVSSPQDEQYSTQVQPFLGLLQRYKNFNFIFSESPFITGHGKVTQRNTPPLLGIAYLLVEGIAPRLGLARHGYEEPEADKSGIEGFLKSTSVVQDSFAAPVVTMPTAQSLLPAATVRFAGWAHGAVRVSIWENGKYLASAPVGADGGWTWDGDKPWSTGEHVVRLFAVDANGYQSERTDVQFTVSEHAAVQHAAVQPSADARALHAAGPGYAGQGVQGGLPAPVVQLPEAYQQVLGTKVGFAGVARGAAQVGFRENGIFLGACAVAPEGRWAWDPGRPWAEGRHTVEVFAVDAAGGESPAAPVPFSVTNASAGAPRAGY